MLYDLEEYWNVWRLSYITHMYSIVLQCELCHTKEDYWITWKYSSITYIGSVSEFIHDFQDGNMWIFYHIWYDPSVCLHNEFFQLHERYSKCRRLSTLLTSTGFVLFAFFDEYEGYWIECRLSLIPYIHRVSLQNEFTFVNVTGNCSYPQLVSLV
jgi:hypothetical protein